MNDQTPRKGAHAAKHERNTQRPPADGADATITFGPAVLETLQKLHARALVHGHEKFDTDAAEILRDMAYGKPVNAEQTLSCLVTVCAEAGRCYAETQDWEIHEALRAIELSLEGEGRGPGEIPVTLTLRSKARGRD